MSRFSLSASGNKRGSYCIKYTASGYIVRLGTLFAEEEGVGGRFGQRWVLVERADAEAGHVTSHGFVEGCFDHGARFCEVVDVECELDVLRGLCERTANVRRYLCSEIWTGVYGRGG